MFKVDVMRNELRCDYSKDAKGIRIPIGQGIAGWVALRGQMLKIDNAYDVSVCVCMCLCVII